MEYALFIWITIGLLAPHTTTAQTIQGFSDQQTCEAAAKEIESLKAWPYTLKTKCVRVK